MIDRASGLTHISCLTHLHMITSSQLLLIYIYSLCCCLWCVCKSRGLVHCGWDHVFVVLLLIPEPYPCWCSRYTVVIPDACLQHIDLWRDRLLFERYSVWWLWMFWHITKSRKISSGWNIVVFCVYWVPLESNWLHLLNYTYTPQHFRGLLYFLCD